MSAAGPALVLGLVACAAPGGGTTAGGAPGERSGTVVVFAAASLTGTFERIAQDFEAAHPGADVVLNLGASSALAQQVLTGAPADVFAAASPVAMATVVAAGDAADAEVFARNRLQIAVPPDNPGGVTGLADLTEPALKIALCAPAVPCGAAAAQVFAAAGLTPSVDTEEQDVKAALAKVTLGEVDAALVYRTDVLAAGGKATGIAFPEADRAVNDYPIATVDGAPNPAGADAFVAHVLSPAGQAVLTAAGFDRP